MYDYRVNMSSAVNSLKRARLGPKLLFSVLVVKPFEVFFICIRFFIVNSISPYLFGLHWIEVCIHYIIKA